jgi:hypothetical protein
MRKGRRRTRQVRAWHDVWMVPIMDEKPITVTRWTYVAKRAPIARTCRIGSEFAAAYEWANGRTDTQYTSAVNPGPFTTENPSIFEGHMLPKNPPSKVV